MVCIFRQVGWSFIYVPVLVVIGFTWGTGGPKKYQQSTFLAFLNFLTSWFGPECNSKFWTAQLHDHTCHIPIQNLGMIKLTLFNWLPATSGKDFGFFSKNNGFVTSSNDSTVLAVSKGWRNSYLGQTQSCQVWCRSKKGFRFTASKRMFNILLSKKCTLSKSFCLFRN